MKIFGLGHALPEQIVTNQDLTRFLDTNDAWIQSRTGIKERRILKEESVNSLAVNAGLKALRDAGIEAEELGLILVSTMLGDQLYPSTACMVQKALGASCPSMDINAACTGFLYAMDIADAYIQCGKARYILIISVEGMSRLVDWEDRSTCVLFGDAAGAALVGPGDSLKSIHLAADGQRDLLYGVMPRENCPFTPPGPLEPHGLQMKGQEVFRFAVSQSSADLQLAIQNAGLEADQIDWFLLHQANRRILEAVRLRLKAPAGKMPSNIHRLGNSSSASLPVLLYELYHSGLLRQGHLLALSAFGSGMTSGACVLCWDKPAPPNTEDPENTLAFGPLTVPESLN